MGNPFSQAESRPFGIQAMSAGVRKAVTMPPALPNLQLWFDPTDADTVWQDAGATMPAGDGDDVGRIDNKGNDPFLTELDDQDFDFPKYRTGILNGLNVLDGASVGSEGDLRGRASGARPGAAGMTMATVTRKLVIPASDDHTVQWDSSVGFRPRLHWSNAGGNNWRASPLGTGFDDQILRPITVDEWIWEYMVVEDNNLRSRASGSIEVVDNSGTYTQNADNEFFFLIQIDGQRGETLVWDIALPPADTTTLIAYLDNKYGRMPF